MGQSTIGQLVDFPPFCRRVDKCIYMYYRVETIKTAETRNTYNLYGCMAGVQSPLALGCSEVSGRPHLRSASRCKLNIPRFCRRTFGTRAFSVAGPTVSIELTAWFVAWSSRRFWTF